MSTMAEHNARDMKTLRLLRSTLSALRELKENEPRVSELPSFDEACDEIRKSAEMIERCWN